MKLAEPKFIHIDNNAQYLIYKIKRKIRTLHARCKKRKRSPVPLFTELFSGFLQNFCILKADRRVKKETLVHSFKLYVEKMYPQHKLIFNEEDFIKYLISQYRQLLDHDRYIVGISCLRVQ